MECKALRQCHFKFAHGLIVFNEFYVTTLIGLHQDLKFGNVLLIIGPQLNEHVPFFL